VILKLMILKLYQSEEIIETINETIKTKYLINLSASVKPLYLCGVMQLQCQPVRKFYQKNIVRYNAEEVLHFTAIRKVSCTTSAGSSLGPYKIKY
jgi:hypothetical protein